MKENISEAQRKQKKGYDDRNKLDQGVPFKEGDLVWLINTAVPKGLSRKFHQQWAGPCKILGRLGSMNYHIKPETGNGKAKVVHRNRLEPAPRRPKDEENWSTDGPSVEPQAASVPHEPRIHHQEKVTEGQPLLSADAALPRRSTRQRRPPDRYQDYNLDEVEIEDALH